MICMGQQNHQLPALESCRYTDAQCERAIVLNALSSSACSNTARCRRSKIELGNGNGVARRPHERRRRGRQLRQELHTLEACAAAAHPVGGGHRGGPAAPRRRAAREHRRRGPGLRVRPQHTLIGLRGHRRRTPPAPPARRSASSSTTSPATTSTPSSGSSLRFCAAWSGAGLGIG